MYLFVWTWIMLWNCSVERKSSLSAGFFFLNSSGSWSYCRPPWGAGWSFGRTTVHVGHDKPIVIGIFLNSMKFLNNPLLQILVKIHALWSQPWQGAQRLHVKYDPRNVNTYWESFTYSRFTGKWASIQTSDVETTLLYISSVMPQEGHLGDWIAMSAWQFPFRWKSDNATEMLFYKEMLSIPWTK